MPEHSDRFVAALYDQDEDQRTPDWGGDELFTRMPRRRAVDTAPPPRFRPALALVDAPPERRRGPRDADPAPVRPGAASMRERAERLGLAVVDERPFAPEPRPEPAREHPLDAVVRQWDGSLADAAATAPPARPTRLITGRPGGVPHAARSSADRRRAVRSHAEWVGLRPERIVGWAFALGLLLILIAITTADAATL